MTITKVVIPVAPFSPFEAKGNRRILQCQCMSNSTRGDGGYRPAVILPGLGNNSSDYQQLKSSLEAKGVSTVVTKVSRPDWLRNAAGLVDGNYWKGTLHPRPVLDWYLKRIEEAVSTANLLANGGKISLIGHSAGGWLARVYLAEYGFDEISLLLTLGTPHLPPPKGVSGVIDQTRGLLDYVEKYCPVSSYASRLKFVCIAGRYIKGERFFKNQSIKLSSSTMETVAGVNGNLIVTPKDSTIETIDNDLNKDSDQLTSSRLRALIVGQGYKQVCGKANVWGDGVVPEVSAHLEGAKNITIEGGRSIKQDMIKDLKWPKHGQKINLPLQVIHHLTGTGSRLWRYCSLPSLLDVMLVSLHLLEGKQIWEGRTIMSPFMRHY